MPETIDAEWLRMCLEPDAQKYAALFLTDQAAAERFRAEVRYDERLAAWKAAR